VIKPARAEPMTAVRRTFALLEVRLPQPVDKLGRCEAASNRGSDVFDTYVGGSYKNRRSGAENVAASPKPAFSALFNSGHVR
jgi:hypothetical protein